MKGPPVGALLFVGWLQAGPVEFDLGDLALILLAMVVILFALPLLAGSIALRVYRSRTPAADQTRRDSVIWFVGGGLGAFVGQYLIWWLADLIG